MLVHPPPLQSRHSKYLYDWLAIWSRQISFLHDIAMKNSLQVTVVSSAHKNWVRLRASGGLEIIIQSNSRRFILVESSPNATFIQRELVILQLVRFLVAVLAKREALYFSAVPFFDDLLDCMDSRGRVKSPRKVHVAPINELNHMLSNERE